MIGKRCRAAGGALAIGAFAASGCSVSSSSAPAAAVRYGSPEQATLSWFYAVNHKDSAAATAHFTRAAAALMDWGGGNTAAWSTFSALRCRPAHLPSATAATVFCSFSESASASEGNPDGFWTVWLQRQRDGRWLIDNYGQG
jgi:hypothetical protein